MVAVSRGARRVQIGEGKMPSRQPAGRRRYEELVLRLRDGGL